MTDETPKQSDQLPEEGPAEQVPDDVPEAGEGAARESGERHAQDADRLGYDDEAEQRAYQDAGAAGDDEEDER
jgi:hypothetical protein